MGGEEDISPIYHDYIADEGWGQNSYAYILQASSPASLSTGSAPLCCLSKVQDLTSLVSQLEGQLSHLLQVGRGEVGRASFPCSCLHMADVGGLDQTSLSHILGANSSTPNRVSSEMVPKQGAASTLSSAVAGEE